MIEVQMVNDGITDNAPALRKAYASAKRIVKNVKYCIGCKHLRFDEPDPGCQGSAMTGTYGDSEAALACQLGHWYHEFTAYSGGLPAFENAMKKAETCPDFEERDTVQSGASHD